MSDDALAWEAVRSALTLVELAGRGDVVGMSDLVDSLGQGECRTVAMCLAQMCSTFMDDAGGLAATGEAVISENLRRDDDRG